MSIEVLILDLDDQRAHGFPADCIPNIIERFNQRKEKDQYHPPVILGLRITNEEHSKVGHVMELRTDDTQRKLYAVLDVRASAACMIDGEGAELLEVMVVRDTD